MLEDLGLDKQAEAVYREMLNHPTMTRAELAFVLGETEDVIGSVLDRLSRLALVQQDEAGPVRPVRRVRPEARMERLLARQEAQLAALQQQIEASRDATAQLMSECTDLVRGGSGSRVEQLTGIEAIRTRIAELTGRICEEIMTFAPGGAQRADDLEEARSVDRPMLERGVRMRTLWLDSIRNDGPTLEYAHWLHSLHGQVRTVPSLPVRMIIMDRECALLPVNTDDATAGAVVVHGQGTIAALCALFEIIWSTGTVLGAPQPLDDRGLTPQERGFLQLLGQGLTDQAIAVRLGVSHRTARRIAAALMEKLGARSRFEAGLKAAAQGWLLPSQ
ncbi:LuxR C-terminal-related transcriptional regulator [Streptomyces sp. NPDC059909]|uniref:LuxR C-terminal-related transcriptional regulator n=1 Tax=Streptomyces sp. NPDC059909 TaxID=3346998 RepID=UPI003652CDE8